MQHAQSIFTTRPIRAATKSSNALYTYPRGNLVIADTIHRNGYDYKYTIADAGVQNGKEYVLFICKGAKVHKKIPKESLARFIQDLGTTLDAVTADNKKLFIKFRVSETEKETIERLAKMSNQSMSDFIKTRLM